MPKNTNNVSCVFAIRNTGLQSELIVQMLRPLGVKEAYLLCLDSGHTETPHVFLEIASDHAMQKNLALISIPGIDRRNKIIYRGNTLVVKVRWLGEIDMADTAILSQLRGELKNLVRAATKAVRTHDQNIRRGINAQQKKARAERHAAERAAATAKMHTPVTEYIPTHHVPADAHV